MSYDPRLIIIGGSLIGGAVIFFVVRAVTLARWNK